MSGDAVVIKTTDNKTHKVPLSRLSAASQAQAKASAAAETSGKPPDP